MTYSTQRMDDGRWRVLSSTGRIVKTYSGKDAQQQATRKAARLNVIEKKAR